MALLLVRHGKSLPKDKDAAKGLSEEGISEVEHIAGIAKKYGVNVSRIMHSEKKRALQTAEIFASALKPDGGIQEIKGINPLDDVAAFADKIEISDNLMLVGHLPFMQRLTSYLITGSIEKPVFKFHNGSILCMDKNSEAAQTWFIKWALMPHLR
ncbi:MAG: phosphohistidine phosphatase SixA [Deltaproteobacteria bacterium]|nr:phosphohistidine phosphatase SixA [Deltaproteobacteria bacterium]